MVADSSSRSLRFGVILDEEGLAGWQLDCLETLRTREGASAAILIVLTPAPGAARKTSLLWRLYRRHVLDRASAGGRLQPVPELLGGIPLLRHGPDQLVTASSVLGDLDLDFVLDFGSRPPPAGLTGVARHGIWSFHFGDPSGPQSLPAGFWEIYRGEPVTVAALLQSGAGTILRSGYFKTDAASYLRNREQLFKEAVNWPAQVCRTLEDTTSADSRSRQSAPATDGPGEPSSGQTLRFLASMAGGFLRKATRWLFRQQVWRVGIIDAPAHEVAGLGRDGRELPPVRWIPNPEGRFLADPFAVEQEDGTLLLLAEDYAWSTARGGISALHIGSGPSAEPRRVFNLPVHLSYPYVFRHEGRLYCVPETHEAGEVGLYVQDPQGMNWTRECVLVSGRRLADSTLVEWEGQWWLFATDVDDEQVRNLHLWLAPDLRGPWREHPGNPVKIDVRSSRPAGRPFVWKGSLYRPAQDCSRVYGGAVAMNRVRCLTPTRFEEEIVHMIHPDQGWPASDGLHHFCGVGERTIIDACEETFVWRAAAASIRRKLGRPRPSR